MQREYEAALGRLITNRTALQLFRIDSESFLQSYQLSEDEKNSLRAAVGQLPALNSSFVGKRINLLKRSFRHTLYIMGDYGEKLLSRFVDIHPHLEDYVGEHELLFDFLLEAVRSSQTGVDQALLEDVLYAESYFFRALRSVVPGEELENINNEPPNYKVEVDSQTSLRVRSGVFYRIYSYNLVNLGKVTSEELPHIPREESAIIFFRKFGEQSNTAMRVSTSVLRALNCFEEGNTVGAVAAYLSIENEAHIETTISNLVKLCQHLCEQQVLVRA